jgi:mitochondrial fission protein ELM1
MTILSRPTPDTVWACIAPGDRAGDIDQVKAIAWALDPQFRCVDLAREFDRLRAAPVRPAEMLPRAIVGVGRKRIAMAAAIRAWSGGATRLIHIGRDRGQLDQLDYLITTPAFPLPSSPKILSLPIAPSDRVRRLLSGDAVAVDWLCNMLAAQGIRPPWINVFLGNPLRGDGAVARQRLRELARLLDRLAVTRNRDLVICGSPRTTPECYEQLAAALASRHHIYRWVAGDPCNPFDAMLLAAQESVVTADSITMISQLIAAGHKTLIFPWRTRSRGSVDALRRLIRPRPEAYGKDIAAFCTGLYEQALAAPLGAGAAFGMVGPQPDIQTLLFQRLRDFVR